MGEYSVFGIPAAAARLDIECMSGYLFKRIATLTVVLGGCLSASVAFAATPAAPLTGSAGESPTGQGPGNSRQNSAVLEARNIAPGDSRSATVTITNRDRVPASFRLTKHGLRERPGQGGGKLSDRLELRVEEVTDQASPATLYSGALGSMPRQTLGRFMPGESRTYRFTAIFADRRTGLADNAYMGGSLSLDFHWRSTQ
jgi:hypothetical protein